MNNPEFDYGALVQEAIAECPEANENELVGIVFKKTRGMGKPETIRQHIQAAKTPVQNRVR